MEFLLTGHMPKYICQGGVYDKDFCVREGSCLNSGSQASKELRLGIIFFLLCPHQLLSKIAIWEFEGTWNYLSKTYL